MSGDYVIAERRLSAYYSDKRENTATKLKVWLRLVNRDVMKSYGEILADLRKNVRALNIRADDIVLKNVLSSDAFKMSDTLNIMTLYPYFPISGTAVQNGSLFAPVTLTTEVYPT